MSYKKFVLAGSLAAIAVTQTLAMVSDQPPSPSPSRHPPIVIGVSNVQSGPSRELGESLLKGSQAYFDMINSHGGEHGRQIQMVVKDDHYEPDPAVQNTNDLITKDGVFFLFDYVGTPTLTRVLPLLRYYERENIVNVAPFTGAEPQRKPPYDKFVFNIRASYREETEALVRYFYGQGYRRIGYFGQADSYGKSGELGVKQALAAYGLKMAGNVTYRRNSSFADSMQRQVEILRSQGAEAIISVGVYGPCAAFIRDARRAGWNAPIANVSFVGGDAMLGLLIKETAKDGQDLTTGLINSQVVPTPEQSNYALVAQYRAHFSPQARDAISLEGWLNAAVVSEALRRAGPDPSRSDFIRAMESLTGWDPGLGVKLGFSSSNHQGMHRIWLTRAVQGRWVPEPQAGAAR
jgi:branched-chain amino acid transport system substrate-binding protein